MNVAKTLTWSLCSEEIKTKWTQQIEDNKTLGIHIHCPEGAVSKDGPSAGTAITVAIYSLLNEKPINNKVAITGEIDLNGNITAIGGLENKIIGSVNAGITTILYPKDNDMEFKEFLEKHDEILDKKIEFVQVDKIQDVFPYVFV
jgi:ATP-dependent Lon protease